MAIELEKPLDCGITARYHRVLRYSVDLLPQAANTGVNGPVLSVTIGEYASAELRQAGALPIRHEHYTWVVLPEDITADLRPVIYMLLKEKHYAGALDLL